MKYKYLFGPVNSRRLGISLGVDLVPYKTCSYDCVYCECGFTTDLTVERKEYVPVEAVCNELDKYLSKNEFPDYITFSGSGEPTLHSGISEIISHIKSNYSDNKIAVLTNSSLMNDPEVRKDISDADLIVPSVDAISKNIFNKIVRPHESISNESILNGLLQFRLDYNSRVVLEIFIIKGVNDTDDEIIKFKEFINKLNPDGVQLNSLDRPAPEEWVESVDFDYLELIREKFKPIQTQIVKRPNSKNYIERYDSDVEEIIMSTLKRRPSIMQDIIYAVGLNETQLLPHIDKLLRDKKIIQKEGERGTFFRINMQ